jgi:hypothetical protein
MNIGLNLKCTFLKSKLLDLITTCCVQVSLKFVYLAAGTFSASLLRKYISSSISSYSLMY